jgi:hypothetical protein
MVLFLIVLFYQVKKLIYVMQLLLIPVSKLFLILDKTLNMC